MHNVSDFSARCKLVLTNGLTGAVYLVERLPRQPGDYAKGYRLCSSNGELHIAHQLIDGGHECNCPAWPLQRQCDHCRVLAAVGLLDEAVDPRDIYPPSWFDELVDIELDDGAAP